TSPCACGRTSPRIRIDGRTDDMLRVQAVNVHPGAIGTVLEGVRGVGRHAVVARGDPIDPPLRVYVETSGGAPAPDAIAGELPARLRTRFAVVALGPGTLPVAEHKTRTVYRTARGDELPRCIAIEEDRTT